jgi:DNA gyrase subunit A
MVQRTAVRGINRYGRASQGVRVMNLRDGDEVSAVALVVESEAQTAASVIEPASLDAAGTADEPALAGGEIDADPTDDSTLTPPEVSEDDLEP